MLSEGLVKLTRLYTFNTPISKGKYRLFLSVLGILKYKPRHIKAKSIDGRRFDADLNEYMYMSLYFLGEYEPFTSRVARSLIGEGDVCVDADANIGWFTTLMAKLVGPKGSVHSFEPVPKTFKQLRVNCDLNGFENIRLNNKALGDVAGVATINLPDDEPSGHASLHRKTENAASFDCELVPLDEYLQQHGIGRVNFLKADIEGAEMMLLRGGEKTLSESMPVMLMEMALEQTHHFGYLPQDLLEFISECGAYRFYRVDENNKTLVRFTAFSPDDPGGNIFCVPESEPEKIAIAENFFRR